MNQKNLIQSIFAIAVLSGTLSSCGTPTTLGSSSSVATSPNSSSNSSSSNSSISLSSASSSGANNDDISAACLDLISNPNTNWRESALTSDQAIIHCLAQTLGSPVGYGEKATGGYNPNGQSHLIVVTNQTNVLPEKQILDAISSDDYNWIVFDKNDFANDRDISMYRLHCGDAEVLSALDNATQAECLDHTLWCANHGIANSACTETFFNDRLNDSNLPIRNEMIQSNTTIDGRGSKANIFFNGFKIGADSSGVSTFVANNVILTHLFFHGAGHAEDHNLDPDMIRSTGESHDIWIHKNTFANTGDSAFDVKVGAYNITISFNRLNDVLRASLHGSSDSRTINEQITTTLHHNAFMTSDGFNTGPHDGSNTARRVPLLRRGKAHMINNVFMNYRKNFASVRVGGTLLLEHNVFLGGSSIKNEKSGEAGFSEWVSYLTKDGFDGGNFSSIDTLVRYADNNCQIDNTYQGTIPATIGAAAANLGQNYSAASRNKLALEIIPAGQDLVDYVLASAGKNGVNAFNSPLAPSRAQILNAPRSSPCL